MAWDSSIFLRVDETRVDVIKALITGPEGTPYVLDTSMFDICSHISPSYYNGWYDCSACVGIFIYVSCSYLFDIFLGPSYNQLPPSVKYMTVSSVFCIWRRQASLLFRQMEENTVSILIFML